MAIRSHGDINTNANRNVVAGLGTFNDLQSIPRLAEGNALFDSRKVTLRSAYVVNSAIVVVAMIRGTYVVEGINKEKVL
jgi:hypothetical protein